MPSSTGSKVRENRLRRMAARQGLALVKSRRRDPRASDHGKYMLRIPHSNAVVAGAGPIGPDLTLDDVEDYLDRREPMTAHDPRTPPTTVGVGDNRAVPDAVTWELEAEAAQDVAEFVTPLAVNLPGNSLLRRKLLLDARDLEFLANMRRLEATAVRSKDVQAEVDIAALIDQYLAEHLPPGGSYAADELRALAGRLRGDGRAQRDDAGERHSLERHGSEQEPLSSP